MNDSLQEYLNVFCTASLDDILIYSRTRNEHLEHVRLVLAALKRASLYVKPSKYEFFVRETKFLRLIVRVNRVRIDLEKIYTVVN